MYLLLVLFCALMTGNTALTKVFQKKTPSDLFHLIMYNIINALFACVFFFVSAGCKININGPTLVYAVVYALIICVNLSAQIFAFSKAPVSVVTLMTMAGGVLLPSVFGIAWFNEPPTVRLLISSILIITAAFLPFVGKPGEKKRFSLAAVLTCMLMFVLSGLSVILIKLYTSHEASGIVCSSTSMFFLTNVAIVFVCIIALTIFVLKNGGFERDKTMPQIFHAFTLGQTLLIFSKTVLANFSSLVQVIVQAGMSASTFSVLNSSMTLIGASAVSAFLFREKQGLGTLFAVILAIAAIIANP